MTPKTNKAAVPLEAKATMPRYQDSMVLLNQGSTVAQAATGNKVDTLLISRVMGSLRRSPDTASHRSRVMASLHRNKDMAVPRPNSLATPSNKAGMVRHLLHRGIKTRVHTSTNMQAVSLPHSQEGAIFRKT